LPVGFIAVDAVGFLNFSDQLIASPADLSDLIVGQLAPLRLDPPVSCFQLPSTRSHLIMLLTD
jgi:hypothetical protein